MKPPSPCHIRIFQALKDGEWHDFTDFCNGTVGGKEGDRRLREMEDWGVYHEWRFKPDTRTTQYRLKEIMDFWYEISKMIKVEKSGQMRFV